MSKHGACSICGKEGRLYRGWCKMHYNRWYKYGDPNAAVKPKTRDGVPVADRFWSMVEKEPGDGCWNWTRFKQKVGYGTFRIGNKSLLAHRVAYELEYGPILDGLEIDHLCGNKSCVRPDHLEAVTREENMRRAPTWGRWKNAAKTHCPHGHEYTEENTFRHKDGRRECLICKRRHNRENARKKRERDK